MTRQSAVTSCALAVFILAATKLGGIIASILSATRLRHVPPTGSGTAQAATETEEVLEN